MKKTLRKKISRYTAVFEPDLEAGGYTATIPALPGCISEGDTFEDAVNNITEAAELYISVMRGRSEEVPKESEGTVIAPVRVRV